MIAFFEMVVAAVNFFGVFFNKFIAFFNSFSILSNAKFGFRLSYMSIFSFFFISFLTITVAFIYFALESIVVVYNLINSILDLISNTSGSSNPILSSFYHFLNVTGVVQGLETAWPFVASALSFRLMLFLYRTTLYVYKLMWKLYVDTLLLLTAPS